MIKCNKSDVNTKDWRVGTNSYDKIIIVATPIAEASITIDKLKFVFDTGLVNVPRYNPETKSIILEENDISESSRLQRKGRVGRTSEGTVYYFYKKGYTENNKTQYNISIENNAFNIINLIRDNKNSIEEEPFLKIDLSKPNHNLTLKDINEQDIKIKSYNYILRLQYTIDNKIYNYYGNDDHYDYYNYKNCSMYYETGYLEKDIIDETGLFYIIHHDEINVNRNINGEFISIEDTKNLKLIKRDTELNILRSKKMFSFLNNMYKLFLIGFNPTTGNIEKSQLGSYFIKFSEKIKNNRENLQDTDILLLIYGKVFNCFDDIIRYLSFKISLKQIKDVLKINMYIRDNNSDITSLINLSKYIDQKLIYYNKLYDFKNVANISKIISNYEEQKKIKNLIIQKNITNRENTQDKFNEYFKEFMFFVKSESEIIIKEICEKINLDYKIIDKFYYEYYEIYKDIHLMSKNEIGSVNNLEIDIIVKTLEPLKKCFIDHDPVTVSLLLANPDNIAKYISSTRNKYLSIHRPVLTNIYSINTNFFKR